VRVSEPVPFKYWAFLSYSHGDKTWGKWLHQALESYRIDKDLVGRQTPVGPVPKFLRPIFRDREEFAAGHSLNQQTIAALEASQFLIVICSPHAAESKYVNEEVRRFKTLGRAEKVLALIVDGRPDDPERECFPRALRYQVGSDGEITDAQEHPIAADARPQGDGTQIALQKLVAGLLGVGLDEIVRRAERARKRRNRIWAAFAGLFLLLAVAATGSAAYAWQQLKTNEAFLDATLSTATGIVDTAVAQAEKYNVPRTATLELLAQAERLFDDMARLGRPTPQLAYRKAWMLIQFARNYEILGDTGKQRARAQEAHRLMQGLAAEDSGNLGFQSNLAVTYGEIGRVLATQGNVAGALASYRASLAIIERLAAADRSNAGWQRDLSVSYVNVGEALVAQGNLAEALASYRASLAIIERLAAADRNNAGWQRDLSISHERVGGVLVAQGKLEEALRSYGASLAIMERLAASDPHNAGCQHDLSVSYNNVGNVLAAQGNLAEALENYRKYLAIMERLEASDPNNADWQRDLSVSYEKVGYVLAA
jgi:tetratricopeptide (TPR) repeat protein